MQETICQVDLETIRVSPFQPRKEFEVQELEELALSIKEVGIIQPPTVRKIMRGELLLYYELIAGERRWRAARLAGLKSIIVVVREITDEMAAKTTLIENIQRVDLNPIEMALGLKRLIEVFQMTQEELADRVGKKRSTVANYLRLLALPKEIQASLMKGEISMGHAKAILSLEDADLKATLHELIINSKLTVREAEKTSQELGKTSSKRASPKKDIYLEDLQEKLTTQFGSKVEVKGGKIIFHYHNLDELDRLLKVLQ